MMNHRRSTPVPEATYLGTSMGGEGYRHERPSHYKSSPKPVVPVPATSFRSPSPRTTTPTLRNMSPRPDPSPMPCRNESPRTPTPTTFRNITAESENYAPSPSVHKMGFLPLTSPSGQVNAGDEKLVNRLYDQIETQEGEYDKLKVKLEEEQKLREEEYEKLKFKYEEEQKRRENLEIELAETKDEIKEHKKRFNNHKKQERELRNKSELDQKERHREDIDRWETTLDEMTQLRKDLTAKSQKLAEFEFLCLNLQQTLDVEKSKAKTDLADAEKRIAVSSEMLQTCHAQLSRADKQLNKERKMKQILIKINEALQLEIKRLQEQMVLIKQQTEFQLSQSLSMQQSKELTEDNTNEIIQDLQIEDALFYFEEVKRQYEDRPKIYRVFLEIIRDYKARALSTPEVIARISKVFQGNNKLIIGFNRFLPKDYHISEEDVLDMQSYNGVALAARAAPSSAATPPTAVVVGTKPPTHMVGASPTAAGSPVVTGKDGGTPRVNDTQSVVVRGEEKGTPRVKEAPSVIEEACSEESKTEDSEREQTQRSVTSKKKSRDEDKKRPKEDKKRDKKARRKGKKDDSSAARSSKSKKSSTGKKAPKESMKSSKGRTQRTQEVLESAFSSGNLVENRSLPMTLTINTSSTLEENAAMPPVKKPPGDLMDDDDTVTCPETNTDFASPANVASPAAADVASPKFDKFQSFNLSTVASSHVFGGIESIDDSFGIGIFSTENTTLYMPTDRYEVIEDQEYNAIEMVADSSYTRNSQSSSSNSSYYAEQAMTK